jgi:hypothetical protein
MMTALRILVGISLLLLADCAKSATPAGVGGETNWLKRCRDDATCDEGSCLCGVCTRACSDDSACSGAQVGACVQTDHGAGAALCEEAPFAGKQAAAVCLPRCANDDVCGDGFRCDRSVCVPDALSSGGGPDVPAATVAGTGGSSGSGGTSTDMPDACPDGGCEMLGPVATALLEQLGESMTAWSALSEVSGDTYWYDEENCGGPGAVGGEVQTIQVENGVGRSIGRRTITQAECTSSIARYGILMTPETMLELYADCAALIRRAPGQLTLRTDSQLVIQQCSWPGLVDCTDFCGEGFVLSSWAFGTPADEDGGAR